MPGDTTLFEVERLAVLPTGVTDTLPILSRPPTSLYRSNPAPSSVESDAAGIELRQGGFAHRPHRSPDLYVAAESAVYIV